MYRLSAREVESVRQSVSPSLSGASSDYLEQLATEPLSSLPAGMADDFLTTLKSVAKAAAPVVEKAAPSVLKGLTQGASVGGPYGALLGAGAGLASGLIKQSKGPQSPAPKPSASPSAKVLTTPPMTVPSSPPAEIPSGQVAAAIFLGLLQNAMVQQALLSQVLGANGRTSVPLPSGATLPRAAVIHLLAELLVKSAEKMPESGALDDQDYLMDDRGEYLVDPASPEQQAAMVLAHLNAGRNLNQPEIITSRASDAQWEDLEWLHDNFDDDTAIEDFVGKAAEFY